jgi:hypothetical protein
MKRNLSLFILIFELIAVVALHAVKLTQEENLALLNESSIRERLPSDMKNPILIKQLPLMP